VRRGDRPAERGRIAQVLVVDDEPDIRELLELTLVRMGLGVHSAGSIAEAKEALKSERFELCLTDMRLADGEGLELVRHIAGLSNDTPVAVITAYGSAENAVAALKAGAFDYVSKPVGLEQLRALVRSALSLADRAEPPAKGQRLLGESAPLVHVREMIAKLARTQAPVYVSGESGSGKELAARLIHENGARRDKPFVPVNCGAIPETLMESEFFGYKKGAFTGAHKTKIGRLEQAAYLRERRAFAEELLVLGRDLAPVRKRQRGLHERAQLLEADRLRDVVERAGLERGDGIVGAAEGGDHGHRQVAAHRSDVAHQLQPLPVREAHVGKAQVVAIRLQARLGVGHGADALHAEAHLQQRELEQLANVGLVVHNQHARARGASGATLGGLHVRAALSRTRKCAPERSFTYSSRPPLAEQSSRAR
jgi:CheY-like chemotaxis protein